MAALNGTGEYQLKLLQTIALVVLLQTGPAAAQQNEAGDLLSQYNKLLAAEQFSEAADSAKRAIALLLREPDYDRLLYGELLTRLADAQHEAADYEAATDNYLLAVQAIIWQKDRLCLELIEPMLSMSRNYHANGQYVDAIKSYEQTLHIQQVNSGLYGAEKALVVSELSESYFQLGDFKRANAMQDSYVTIVARQNPGADMKRLPSMYSRAGMLARTGHGLRSLEAYRRIIALIERADDPRSLELIPAFMAVSRHLVRQHILDGDDGFEKARRYLRRAADIVEKSDDADPRLKAEVYIGIGDFLSTHTPDRDAVVNSYRRGWQEMSKDAQLLEERNALFEEPFLLNPTPAGSPSDMLKLLKNAAEPNTAKNGVVIVKYDINSGGRPGRIKIVEAVPAKQFDYLIKTHVERFAFRPQFVDGEPVATPEQLYEIRFSYDAEEMTPEVGQNEALTISD